MEFDVEFEIEVKTDKGRILKETISRFFNLPYYVEDMHPDKIGYYQYFADESAEEYAINNFIDNVEVEEIEDCFFEQLEEDEKIIEIIK